MVGTFGRVAVRKRLFMILLVHSYSYFKGIFLYLIVIPWFWGIIFARRRGQLAFDNPDVAMV